MLKYFIPPFRVSSIIPPATPVPEWVLMEPGKRHQRSYLSQHPAHAVNRFQFTVIHLQKRLNALN
eukprot:14785429-Ditylum_brightwellii.AAC.1